MIKRFFIWLWLTIYPPKCLLCRKILPRESIDLCTHCRTNAPEYIFSKKHITHTAGRTSVWYYKDDVRKSILRYKFNFYYRNQATTYGRLLAMRVLTDFGQEFDLVTWVTPSLRRRLQRGFDHGRKIAKFTAKELGLPLVQTLKKTTHTARQATLKTAEERRANLLGAFVPYKPEQFVGKRILLIDDIVTTGSTASECARVLKTAGAKSVHLATVAATENHH